MSTALLILASILPATGPAPILSDIREASLVELLSGSWSGTWTRAGQTDGGARLERGRLTLLMAPPWPVRLALREEGDGRFRGTLGGDYPIVGIWKYDAGRLVLCWRSAAKGQSRAIQR